MKVPSLSIKIDVISHPFPDYPVAEGYFFIETPIDGFLAGKRGRKILQTELLLFNSKKVVLRKENDVYRPLAIVGQNFAVIPNELILDELQEAARATQVPLDLLQLNLIRESDLDSLHIPKKYMREVGTFRFYLDDLSLRIDILLPTLKAEVAKEDEIAFGLSIRNALDGKSAFAIDAYSERLKCTNGATRRQTLRSGSYHRHIGDPQQLRKHIQASLQEALQCAPQWASDLLHLYKRWAECPLTLPIAQALLDLDLAEKYYKTLPLQWHYEEEKIREAVEAEAATESLQRHYEEEKTPPEEKRKARRIADSLTEEISLWETFNHITQALSSGRMHPIYRSFVTHHLHALMEEASTLTKR